MAIVGRRKWTCGEEDAALVLLDPLLFLLWGWRDDLTIPLERTDLPKRWRGKQVVSKEQRLLFLDGADYMLMRDVMPEVVGVSSQYVLARTSRKVGKTVALEGKIVQIALVKTGEGIEEGMVHAPGDAHLDPVINRVLQRIERLPLLKLMHRGMSRTDGIQNWRNGFVWHYRIEGQQTRAEFTGRSQVGLRARYILGDEGDFSREEVYEQREQCALPGCFQYWGGVPRGVRLVFYREANKRRGRWSVHRMDMRANPLFQSQRAWREVIAGDSYQSQRVQTQVLGRDGEDAVTCFPVIAVDTLASMVVKSFGIAEYEARKGDLGAFLKLPRAEGDAWIVHLDYGYSPSPMMLGVSYLSEGVWRLAGRYEILLMDPTRAAQMIAQIDQEVLPRRAALIVLDAHGQGKGVLSNLVHDERYVGEGYESRAVDVGFQTRTQLEDILTHRRCGQRVRVLDERLWVCDTCKVQIFSRVELAPASLQTKVYLTDELKAALNRGQEWLERGRVGYPSGAAIVLPYDEQLINELRGTTEILTPGGGTKYVSPNPGQEHATDMLRCLVSGIIRFGKIVSEGQSAETIYREFGWAGAASGKWVAPWDVSEPRAGMAFVY